MGEEFLPVDPVTGITKTFEDGLEEAAAYC